jgi:delta14-sterol reductase
VQDFPESVSPQGVVFGLEAYGGLIVALFLGAMFLPGRKILGQPLRDGTRIPYRINGMSLWVATHMFLFTATYFYHLSLTPLLQHFWSLLVAANVLTLAWLLPMYAAGKKRQRESGEPGRNLILELWYGVELNPRFWDIDLKTFAYHPSLIGLCLLNWAFAYAQYEQFGYLTLQMMLYQGFWWMYFVTHFHYEPGVLSMWDVIAERFGFMLLWGDLVLVPFFYCVGGWYLLDQPESISLLHGMALCTLFSMGLWIFRGSNAQKNQFKANRDCKIWGQPAKTVGGRLLVSGWWGVGRKINYTGEIMVYSSFGLTTGFASIVPYLLPIWLFSLLVHRAWRDEQRCREKYGETWDEYCKVARFRMIPFIY